MNLALELFVMSVFTIVVIVSVFTIFAKLMKKD